MIKQSKIIMVDIKIARLVIYIYIIYIRIKDQCPSKLIWLVRAENVEI
jgi:hypothetical protein